VTSCDRPAEKKKDQSLSCAQLMYGDENVNAAAILKVITF